MPSREFWGPTRLGGERLTQQIRRIWIDESGQDMVKYALLVALLTLVVPVAMRLFGPTIATFFNNVSSNLNTI